jgi:hypothetical protein
MDWSNQVIRLAKEMKKKRSEIYAKDLQNPFGKFKTIQSMLVTKCLVIT